MNYKLNIDLVNSLIKFTNLKIIYLYTDKKYLVKEFKNNSKISFVSLDKYLKNKQIDERFYKI